MCVVVWVRVWVDRSEKELRRRRDLVSNAHVRVDELDAMLDRVPIADEVPAGGTRGGSDSTGPIGRATGARGRWGEVSAMETEETVDLEAGDLLELQRRTMEDQDRGLDALLDVTGRLKSIGHAIGDELDLQNGMLEELDHDVERTSMNIDRETRNVMAVTRRAKNGYSMCFVGVLIILLAIVLAVALSQ